MKIPFICVNYNGHNETIKYIKNVKSLNDSNEAIIIIVDNSPHSSDFELLNQFILTNYKDVEDIVLLKRDNRGYFQALNEGILYFKQLYGTDTMFIIGNNDITFKEDFLFQLKKLSLNEDILVIAPDVITNEGSHENPHVIHKIGFVRKLMYDIYFSNFFVGKILANIKSTERRFKPHDAVSKEIHMGIGALYVLTPQYFKHFEKLPEEVFLYGEEAVLAGQLQAVKGKTLYEPKLLCWHNESSTTSNLGFERKYKTMQNSYKIYRKYL